MASLLEEKLLKDLNALGIERPEREFVFHPKRKWRFDFAFLREKLAVEVEGGVFSRGRHTSGVGFANDCDKYNAAALAGWVVLRFTGAHIASGEAAVLIRAALELGRVDIHGKENAQAEEEISRRGRVERPVGDRAPLREA